jgi:glycosyltransferase involved in cell wall biosynthesis
MADEGAPHCAETLRSRPMGGVETAFALLAQALAARGHAVRQTRGGELGEADLVIANRVPRLFAALPRRGRRVLWLHNPAGYLRKPRHAVPLLRARPVLVALGRHHQATIPWWLPGQRVRIPLAVAPPFDAGAAERAPPPPVAVFTSNPLRGLDWLLTLWAERILPAVPGAELHCYTGSATYGGDPRLAARAAPVLARAAATPGVRLLAPVARPLLRDRLLGARAMLYRGDPGETFCLALAEAQALGLPAVVTALGAVPERVQDGETGVVAASDAAFAQAAIALLRDNTLWTAMHRAALARGAGPGWDAVAAEFERLAG